MTCSTTYRVGLFLIAAMAVCLVGGQAQAATTSIVAPPPGEDNHLTIFENVYGGGTWSAFGNDFSNGSLTAVRMDDDDDQVFSLDTLVDGSARAVFARFNQSFGYLAGDSSSGSIEDDYTELFGVSGNGYSVAGSQSDIDLTGSDFRWARKGANGVASSKNSDNPTGQDHLITYTVQGLNAPDPVYMLFFEDLFGDASDNDYNDLVVEISAVSPTAAPTPAAVVPGLALLGFAAFGRRRRHRHA